MPRWEHMCLCLDCLPRPPPSQTSRRNNSDGGEGGVTYITSTLFHQQTPHPRPSLSLCVSPSMLKTSVSTALSLLQAAAQMKTTSCSCPQTNKPNFLFLYEERQKQSEMEKSECDDPNKPEHVGSSKEEKQKDGRTDGRRRWGEECLQNVRREPKSTGQQTVREGKTRADKKTKYCSELPMSERTEEETVQTPSS